MAWGPVDQPCALLAATRCSSSVGMASLIRAPLRARPIQTPVCALFLPCLRFVPMLLCVRRSRAAWDRTSPGATPLVSLLLTNHLIANSTEVSALFSSSSNRLQNPGKARVSASMPLTTLRDQDGAEFHSATPCEPPARPGAFAVLGSPFDLNECARSPASEREKTPQTEEDAVGLRPCEDGSVPADKAAGVRHGVAAVGSQQLLVPAEIVVGGKRHSK